MPDPSPSSPTERTRLLTEVSASTSYTPNWTASSTEVDSDSTSETRNSDVESGPDDEHATDGEREADEHEASPWQLAAIVCPALPFPDHRSLMRAPDPPHVHRRLPRRHGRHPRRRLLCRHRLRLQRAAEDQLARHRLHAHHDRLPVRRPPSFLITFL